MSIEEEIYSKLVEQFGIGEICIKKYRTREEITWLQFIEAALKFKTLELYAFCGFSGKDTFNTYFRREFYSVTSFRNKRCWSTCLLDLISKRVCSSCKEIKPLIYFSSNIHNVSGLRSSCRDCDCTHQKEYYLTNKYSVRKYQKNYFENNRYIFNAKNAKRRAAKLQATPKWADLEKIKEKYRTCPEGFHVDHEIPLQGELVCGLHVHENLQHLSAHENLSKGNKYEP